MPADSDDMDGDGYDAPPLGEDCDDGDALVHPYAVPICGNDVDDDCDGAADCAYSGTVDVGAEAKTTLIGTDVGQLAASVEVADVDGDGRLDLVRGMEFTAIPTGTVDAATLTLLGTVPGLDGLGDVDNDGWIDAIMASEGALMGPLTEPDRPFVAADEGFWFACGLDSLSCGVGDLSGDGQNEAWWFESIAFGENLAFALSPWDGLATDGYVHAPEVEGLNIEIGATRSWPDVTGDGVAELALQLQSDPIDHCQSLLAGPLEPGDTWTECHPNLALLDVAVAVVGDFDGDGYNDVLNTGWLLIDDPAVLPGPIDVTQPLEPIANWSETWGDDQPNGLIARAVGDTNGDGRDDVVFDGAVEEPDPLDYHGVSSLFEGAFYGVIEPERGLVFDAVTSQDFVDGPIAGAEMRALADVDGDTILDLVLYDYADWGRLYVVPAVPGWW